LEIAGNRVIDAAASLTLTNVSILNNQTLRNNGTVTIDGLTGAANSTFVNASGSTLVINGQLLSTGILNVSTCSNTVIYNGTAAQTIKPTTYCNIIMNNNGQKTASADFGTNGDLTVNFGSNLTIGSGIIIQVRGIATTSGAINNGGHLLISD
jgi:aspartate 1-decarboxylase